MKTKKWFKVKCCNEIVKYTEFLNNKIKTHRSIRLALKKHLLKHNSNILQYYDMYYSKLEKCNFCNTEFAKYTYILSIDESYDIVFDNVLLFKNAYMCENKICSKERSKFNPNSDIKISKKFNLSIEQAREYRIKHNKSCFYYHPDVDNIDEYRKGQARTLEWYIKKYGEEEGYKRSKKHYDKLSVANKKETFIKKYGIDRANKISEDKKNTLQNFIKRHGEEEGKSKYINFIKKNTVSGVYINDRYTMSSKISFNFFTQLTEELIKENLVDKNDIIFSNGYMSEYQIRYFNINNKLRWFFLDYVILSKKINIEFNGSKYHANPSLSKEEQLKWRAIYSNKTFDEQIEYETYRDNIIKSHGFNIIKIWDFDVNTVEKNRITLKNTINKIKELIKNENIV